MIVNTPKTMRSTKKFVETFFVWNDSKDKNVFYLKKIFLLFFVGFFMYSNLIGIRTYFQPHIFVIRTSNYMKNLVGSIEIKVGTGTPLEALFEKLHFNSGDISYNQNHININIACALDLD